VLSQQTTNGSLFIKHHLHKVTHLQEIKISAMFSHLKHGTTTAQFIKCKLGGETFIVGVGFLSTFS
jgi:hypothetical protein